MRKKKVFVSPRVTQEILIQLEEDLLGTSTGLDTVVRSMGQGVQSYTFTEDATDSEATYFVEWD